MTNENNSNNEGLNWKKIVSFVNIIGLIVNGALAMYNLSLVLQTLEIRRASLEYQEMMYNFTSVIVVSVDYANLGKPSTYSVQDGVVTETTHYGYLNVTFQVITPHYGTLSTRLKSFNVGDSEYLVSGKRNETSVTYADWGGFQEHIVVPGLNHITDQLHLKATIYPDLERIPPEVVSTRFPLGRLSLEAELFDLQSNTTISKEFSANILVTLEPLP